MRGGDAVGTSPLPNILEILVWGAVTPLGQAPSQIKTKEKEGRFCVSS